MTFRGDAQRRIFTGNVILKLSFKLPTSPAVYVTRCKKKFIFLTSPPGTVLTEKYFLMVSSGQYLKFYDCQAIPPLNNIAYKQRRNNVMIVQCVSATKKGCYSSKIKCN